MSDSLLRASFDPTLLQTRTIGASEIRATDDGGGFEGYACRWEVEDSYRTTFVYGCFTEGGLDGGLYPLLVMHNVERVAGAFTAIEDTTGLWIAGMYDSTQEGQDARARAKSGSAPELSVGFNITGIDPEVEGRIIAATLFETSQITARMASQPGAALSSVRVGAAAGGTEVVITTGPNGAIAGKLRLLGH